MAILNFRLDPTVEPKRGSLSTHLIYGMTAASIRSHYMSH
jgi:hypothetical protein